MNGFDLTITLKDDCVLSERAATEGGHAGLDYLPGATLLGAAATKLYPEVSKVDAFTLFHSGHVRFGNGLPVSSSDEPSWPMPLSWYHAKGEVDEEEPLDCKKIWNLGGGREIPDNKQPKQLRSNYTTSSGILVKPDKSLRMKTAINPQTGRAYEAMLFGYDALRAGQTFRARISIDENVLDEDLLKQLKKALSGELLLGRSRSAEYGRVWAKTSPLSEISHQKNNATRITLWLLSDLAALDNLGQPTLFPRSEWLGLPKGKLIISDSHLRTRCYSPWNAKRGGPDIERHVISQGSVLVFELENTLNDTHHACIATALGAHREAGLGQVWLNPPLLEGKHPQFVAPPAIAGTDDPQNRNNKSPLIEWLESQKISGNVDFATRARKLAKEYSGLIVSARKLKGLDNETEVGPSRSQWGSVLALAKNPPGENFTVVLFDTHNGPCKPKAPGWQDEHWDAGNKRTRSFAKWLRDTLKDGSDPRLVRRLAREIMDVIIKEARQ